MSANFWGNPELEPKRAYRYTLEIPELDGAKWIVKKVKKPSFTVTEAEHSFINHKFYYPGRVEWDKISLTIVDPISPDATQNLMSILSAAGYVFPETEADALSTTITKNEAYQALGGQVIIRQISGGEVGNPQSTVIEKWTLKNCFITSVDFGELDYDSDDLVNIEIEIRYDWAVFEKPEGESP